MIVSVANPILQTWIFSIFLFLAILISLRAKNYSSLFPPAVSSELKGFAILAVVLSHVGYFLVSDHRFLYPLSTFAGVGVNLFLMLSGYGLVMSSFKNKKTLFGSYCHRFRKLLIPLWITLALFFFADYLFLDRQYSFVYIIHSFLGFFPQADLYNDINSPLWYITPVVFYYLIFPLVFYKKRPWLSAVLIYFASYFITHINFAPIALIVHMYKIHLLAFPIGMLVANGFAYPDFWQKIKNKLSNHNYTVLKVISVILALVTAIYFSVNAYIGVGSKEEWASVAVVLALVFLFIILPKESKFLHLLGDYSYEIYLLHWPLLYRYDLFFKFLPAGLAMVVYIPFLLGLAYLLRRVAVVFDKDKKVVKTS